MASALGSAKYTKIDIQKKKSKKYGRGSRKIVKTRVDLKGKVLAFNYSTNSTTKLSKVASFILSLRGRSIL